MKPIVASRHHTIDANKPTPSVTTSRKDAIFCAGERQDATEHEDRKPTPSVATRTQDGIFGTDERQNAIEHDMENRRQASRRLSRCRQKTPYLAQVSLGMTLDTTLQNLRQASRHHQKTLYLA
jgi:hypothetical protein